jgi:hypothetical protein
MPPLPDPLGNNVSGPREYSSYRPVHPSPTLNGLRLEALSSLERIYWGRRCAIDTPYYALLTGYGEAYPAIPQIGEGPPHYDVILPTGQVVI